MKRLKHFLFSNKVLIGLVIVMGATAVVIVYLVAMSPKEGQPATTTSITASNSSTGTSSSTSVSVDTSTSISVATSSTETAYGAYEDALIKADVPSSWSIVTYNNTSGMKMSAGGSYIGFTGLEIKDGGKSVFYVGGVDGIGGTMYCENVYKFSDTEDAYVQYRLEEYKNLAQKDGVLIDLEDKAYVSLSFLNSEVRRVGNHYYFDTQTPTKYNDKYFNPECGSFEKYIYFSGIKFKVSANNLTYDSHGYYLEYSSSLTEDEYKVLDHILESIKVK